MGGYDGYDGYDEFDTTIARHRVFHNLCSFTTAQIPVFLPSQIYTQY